MHTLDEIREMVYSFAKQICAPISVLPTFNISRDDGTPCIQVERDQIYYFARDRSTTCMSKQTSDLNELLYWIFSDVTFSMSTLFEVDHRIKGVDPRRLIFSYQIELLEKMNADWAKKERMAIDEILENYPYDDNVFKKNLA